VAVSRKKSAKHCYETASKLKVELLLQAADEALVQGQLGVK